MYYFAYGSNLKRKQMTERCPDSRPLYKGILPNFKLIFSGWSRKWRGGVASIKPSRDDKVKGAVYEISERDLRRLDEYEGYPAVYDRINVLVLTDDGDALQAVTYIKKEQSEETKPSQDYLLAMRQGYKDWVIS
ncbi:gamma-glutamylcyclotransferase family protein [Chloroflexota bacterium]